MSPWAALRAELALWRAENRRLAFWWRDDDAVAVTPALDRLADLAFRTGVPAHLAVIPKYAGQPLADRCAGTPLLIPLVHGWAHENHAPLLQKNSEFGHDRPGLIQDALQGLHRIEALFGHRHLPCFVPPWNRVFPDLIRDLADLGYSSLSTFSPRKQRLAAPGLVQINTHIDPIDWRGSRSLVNEDALLDLTLRLLQDRRKAMTDGTEPLGLLTHHLVHDDAIWAFTDALLQTLLDGGAVPLNLFELRDDLP
jgi:hypothetical protein